MILEEMTIGRRTQNATYRTPPFAGGGSGGGRAGTLVSAVGTRMKLAGTLAKTGFSKALGFAAAHPALLAGVGAAVGGAFLLKKLFGRKGKQRQEMNQLINSNPNMASWAQANAIPGLPEKKQLDRLRQMAKASGYPTKPDELADKPIPQMPWQGLPQYQIASPELLWPQVNDMTARRLAMLRSQGVLV